MAEINTLAVIGAGDLGRSIACATVLAGYRTILEDILPASLRRADRQARDFLEQSIQSGKVSRQEAEAALARLEFAGDLEEAARQADLVIEAVPDEMESKLEIFTLLDKIAKPHTILATTTTTLNVAEIASITYRAGKVIGLRFSESMLEVVRATTTDQETIAVCLELGHRISEETIVVKETFPD